MPSFYITNRLNLYAVTVRCLKLGINVSIHLLLCIRCTITLKRNNNKRQRTRPTRLLYFNERGSLLLTGCILRSSGVSVNNRALAHHENAANVEDKTKEIFSYGNWDLFSCKKKKILLSVLQIGCISMDVQGVYNRDQRALCSDEGLTLETSANTFFTAFSISKINFKLIHCTFYPHADADQN